MEEEFLFCENCGNKVHRDAVVCPKCGAQLKDLKTSDKEESPQVVINNTNTNVVTAVTGHSKKRCDKWVSLLLCIFLGYFGAHKFYEGRTGTGILYLLTFGLCGFGVIIDFIIILCKPNPYYV